MQNNIVKYGLIIGSIIVLIPFLAGQLIGSGTETYKTGEIIGYSTMILSLLIIFLAVNEYQKGHPNENVGFGKIMLLGVGISAIAGIMFGTYNLIYVTWIDPDFMQQYFAYYIDNIRQSGASEGEIQKQIAQLEEQKAMFMNPVLNFVVMAMTVFGIGLIVSVVSGLFQSRKNRQLET